MKIRHTLPAIAIAVCAIACSTRNASQPAGAPAAQGAIQQAANPADRLTANEWCGNYQNSQDSHIGIKYTFQRDGILITEKTDYSLGLDAREYVAQELGRWELTSAGLKINDSLNQYQILNRRNSTILYIHSDDEAHSIYVANCSGDLALLGQVDLMNIAAEAPMDESPAASQPGAEAEISLPMGDTNMDVPHVAPVSEGALEEAAPTPVVEAAREEAPAAPAQASQDQAADEAPAPVQNQAQDDAPEILPGYGK